ncbi:MBL fold metallo-hydrolase [Enterobacter cloacae subsp. cloacae]|uniref:MBL fold metallo-hydrolase n=1 Tax=Salmonella enteritidis TaxID=149539 RepID=A0A5V0BQC7_SALEN|nr:MULTISPECIES: MBL fold metallo-hydrolase [Enterobacterales]EBS5459104.1 MBL fold metallo-hydrolase [Salmonella enterica subsp. enterica serovar Enteritidis]EBS5543367.1 MBL fold metallo-hydrolase [Salmonella enterica subsp. enterica serovar Plymouth]ECA1251829.1 MBL fold metallo-hydrolase [Salmonella enterica subsp. enterica serovar Chailey]EBX4513154.1 MBL fold metallo-hydrolase [Salmonella enterica subsp. enterica serovar Plymouth]EBY2850032.1 MBL fold metallo-hydrolase [Salmonella enteri
MIEQHQIGEFTLITLLDGMFLCDGDFIPAAKSEEGTALFKSVGLPAVGPSPEPINAFILKKGEQIWMVDAGCGAELGPRFGKVPSALKNAGYQPEKVEGVILSHLHEDHIGGLINENREPYYPNAKLYLSEVELEFWTDTASKTAYPKLVESGLFDLVESVLVAYDGAIHPIAATGEVIPGVHLVPLYGHTPGHSGISITDGEQQLLIWGDVVHSTLLQLRYPHWSIGFDLDPPRAIATRKELLAELANSKTLVAGPHVTGIGKIVNSCEGGYKMHLHSHDKNLA